MHNKIFKNAIGIIVIVIILLLDYAVGNKCYIDDYNINNDDIVQEISCQQIGCLEYQRAKEVLETLKIMCLRYPYRKFSHLCDNIVEKHIEKIFAKESCPIKICNYIVIDNNCHQKIIDQYFDIRIILEKLVYTFNADAYPELIRILDEYLRLYYNMYTVYRNYNIKLEI